jgi:hypothetical protein
MPIDRILEPESDHLSIASPGEALPSSFHPEEIDIIALRLWQRGSRLEMLADGCCFCKGEAQRCLAICR